MLLWLWKNSEHKHHHRMLHQNTNWGLTPLHTNRKRINFDLHPWSKLSKSANTHESQLLLSVDNAFYATVCFRLTEGDFFGKDQYKWNLLVFNYAEKFFQKSISRTLSDEQSKISALQWGITAGKWKLAAIKTTTIHNDVSLHSSQIKINLMNPNEPV